MKFERRSWIYRRSLCVRKTGFSEYFVALSPQEQQEVLDRTEHDV